MSAPSTLTAEANGAVALLPGVNISATGGLTVDSHWLGCIGAGLDASAPVATQLVAAGPRWFAEQVVVAGQCVVLRLRPRRSSWRRWWAARRGEPAQHEEALAARWALPRSQHFSWGVLECGVDSALRGAAVITLRAHAVPCGSSSGLAPMTVPGEPPGSPPALPPPARVFWRQRTVAECRALVASAVAAALTAGHWSCSAAGLVFGDGECIPSRPGAAEPAQWLPSDFVWQEGLGGAWRVRGARAGWRFTLGYTETADGPSLAWLMARLNVDDAGPWEPLLEQELHRAHQNWLSGTRGSGCTAQAVNDTVARTGAELLFEWRAKPQP